MAAQENEALVRRFLNEAYNRGTLGINDELLTADCVFHIPLPLRGSVDGRPLPAGRPGASTKGPLRSIALTGKEARCASSFGPP